MYNIGNVTQIRFYKFMTIPALFYGSKCGNNRLETLSEIQLLTSVMQRTTEDRIKNHDYEMDWKRVSVKDSRIIYKQILRNIQTCGVRRLPREVLDYRCQSTESLVRTGSGDSDVGPVSYTHLDVYKRQFFYSRMKIQQGVLKKCFL